MYALTETFKRFFDSEKTSGIILIGCTVLSLSLANSTLGPDWLAIWHADIAGLSLGHWINDGLMAIFFLLIGLELERELYVGELSNFRNALLPVVAAIGGMAAPALIHFVFNTGLPTQAGIGIPMATDIAFALGALALLGTRVPPALKVFVVAFAVIDDLGAIILIALFYSGDLSISYLVGGLAVWGVLLLLNRYGRVYSLPIYLICGVVMWALMLKSGVHATIAGVMLAFAIPFWSPDDGRPSPSHRLENLLHKPVAFLILPLFALANTGVVLDGSLVSAMLDPNSLGIVGGLVIGKPVGILLCALLTLWLGWCVLPEDLNWRHVLGAVMLGGIGFTMSIFITNLAFANQPEMIDISKLAVFTGSLIAGVLGSFWLAWVGRQTDLESALPNESASA
ncbi:MAG: Na+/H+ antiporter NhaA [Burkholderiaceae bacterium]